MKKYDIFLSYRRKGGWETAKHLYDLMTRDGYSVSFDIDTLREGLFDEELLRRIDECTDFIVILDEHVFDRTIYNSCPKENDWLRRELAYAIELNKNIIPIMLGGFDAFPDNLPDDIIKVQRYNGPKFDNYYFDTFYERLINIFVQSKSHQKTDNNLGCLKVVTDTECRVYIDYEDKGIARPHQIMRIPICAGSYCLLFKSISDNNNFIEDIGYDISANTEPLYQVRLKKDNIKTAVQTVSSEPEITPEEMYNEGEKFFNGKGVSLDYKKAIQWYRKAAENGNAEAMCKLGECYRDEKGVTKDYTQALYWTQKGAEAGNTAAILNLASLYLTGEGVTQDYNRALPLLKKAVEQGNADAMLVQAIVYEEGAGVPHDAQQAAFWYEKAARNGQNEAMYYLGSCYEKGTIVKKDYTKAAYWYQKAAESGNSEAINKLAYCYEEGRGVTKDYKKAVYWYEKAIENGDTQAMCMVGSIYNNGIGVAKDSKYAASLFKKASEQGDSTAMYLLADCYRTGSGVNKNSRIAVRLEEAARLADAEDIEQALEIVRDALTLDLNEINK